MARSASRISTATAGALGMGWRGVAIAQHLKQVDPRRLGQFVRRIRLAARMLRDVGRGRYRHLPWKTVGALGAALTYFLLPLDAVPDFIPLTGFLDDALMLGLVFGAAESDLRAYCEWLGLDPGPFFE